MICSALVVQMIFLVLVESADYKVVEETPIDTVIGNIAHLHPTLANANSIIYYTDSRFIKISHKGDLLMAKKVDLETICNEFEQCCGDIRCIIRCNVIAKDSSSDQTKSLEISLEIQDTNDNLPRFSKPTQIIEVAEDEPVGKFLYLEQAYDPDVNPINKITHYNFKEETGTFQLDQTQLPTIRLVIKRPLDYERRKIYQATLEACDIAIQCSSQKLEIMIRDINDNFPVFPKQNYQSEVLENFPVGQQILKVEAVDKDSDKFNKIRYEFHETADGNLRRTFIITQNTGSIKLQKPLSAKVRQIYKFKVSAVDEKAAAAHKAVVNVLITVRDLNDHEPVIRLLGGTTNGLEIYENEEPREIVTLRVTDEDINENANVSCKLELPDLNNFKLKKQSNNLYSFLSVRKFDYESERSVKVTIICEDHGIPRNIVRKPLTVYIKDVNEFAPKCEKNVYEIRVQENRLPGYRIFKVKGEDKDGSAKLTYSLYGVSSFYFAIDSNTGEITAGERTLDRESMERLELQIKISDANEKLGEPDGKTGQCRISIIIVDENDNSPRFTVSSREQFTVTENRPIYTNIDGVVSATDDDKDVQNSKVFFGLLRLFNECKEIVNENIFQMKDDGRILTLQRLDRERNRNYTLEVKAYDTGIPSRWTSMNITVLVLDVNDNAPIWLIPKSNLNGMAPSLNISANIQLGSVVTKLDAFDPDLGENGRITYSILNNNKYLFIVNESTGELTVANLLPVGSLNLFLRASDNGYPPQHSEMNLMIFINGDEIATLNMSIILVLIGVTGIISVFLIVAIVCVRRKPRYDTQDVIGSQQSFEPTKNCDVYNTGTWIPNLEEFNPNTGQTLFSDTSSLCFIPADVAAESVLPMHTFMNKNDTLPPLLSYQNIDSTVYGGTLPSNMQAASRLYNTNMLQKGVCYDMGQPQYNSNTMATISSHHHGSPGGPRCLTTNDIDDDSADSGKGGSEDDAGLQQHQLPLLGQYTTFDSTGKSRHYTTMPFQTRQPSSSSVSTRLVARQRNNQTPNNINQCPCYILPEDSILQSSTNHDTSLNNNYNNHICKPSQFYDNSTMMTLATVANANNENGVDNDKSMLSRSENNQDNCSSNVNNSSNHPLDNVSSTTFKQIS